MINKNITNKTILVTGGTGSFGKKFTINALKKLKPKKIIIFSRDELKQYEMQNILKDKRLRFFIGDIRDLSRLKTVVKNVDTVIHTAALKHVHISEYNPFETIKTNVIGAQNIIEACLSSSVQNVIALSTDKAAAPINLYGASKLAADKLFVAANNFKGNQNIKFSIVRYGNVMCSRGSVVPFFLKCKKKNFIPITNKEMTRFNITLDDSVKFVNKCFSIMKGGEIFIPKIPSYRLIDLAKAISKDAKIKIIGIRPGEKLHEEMITMSDSLNTVEFKDYFIILPGNIYYDKYQTNQKKKIIKNGKTTKKPFSYDSLNNRMLSVSEIKKIIKNNLPEGQILDD